MVCKYFKMLFKPGFSFEKNLFGKEIFEFLNTNNNSNKKTIKFSNYY